MRKFYRTILHVIVLSEDAPVDRLDLAQINEAITDGDCSGSVRVVEVQQLTSVETANQLMEQGSDPEFFQLSESGDDLEGND